MSPYVARPPGKGNGPAHPPLTAAVGTGRGAQVADSIGMMKRALPVVLLGIVSCGDNMSLDKPPEVPSARIALSTDEDTAISVDGTAIDPEGETLVYLATAPRHGAIVGTGPTYRYTPEPDYNGTDAFQITISDDHSSVIVPVDLTIVAVNDAPVAADVAAVTNQDQGVAVMLSATDLDSVSLTYEIVTAPAHGTLAGLAPALTYTPASNYFGADSFTVRVSDGELTSNVATVSLTISNIITCGDGVLEGAEQCDDGNDDNGDACLDSCVIASCGDGVIQGKVEGCDDGNADNGDACLTTCEPAACGDGVVQTGVEGCDDGNDDNGDACLDTCVAATCGDGIVQVGLETCDDGNDDNGDACLDSCVAASCGDGVVQVGVEQCDDANSIDGDACRNTCAAASCGDGVVQVGIEACDDGNDDNGDACLDTCVAASCGDGIVRAGLEQCDDGNDLESDGCLGTCVVATCGDGVVRAGLEQCDDANDVNTDACLDTCVTATCGDGVVQAAVEACDDGNDDETDGCLSSCTVASCGDGVVQAGLEQCDDGNAVQTDGCLSTCVTATCGDGFIRTGIEGCDDGNDNNGDACLDECVAATCGDGYVQTGVEQCDDANGNNGDACLTSCIAATCGDGFVRAGVEQCDDANGSNADGCLTSCMAASCGDGFVQSGFEQCDDGNANNGDACLDECVAATCGDGYVRVGVEQCDDANGNNGDACLTSCIAATCGDGFVRAGVEQCDDANGSNGDGCLTTCAAATCGDGFVRGGFEQCDDGNQSNSDACLDECVAATCGDGFVEAGVEQCDDANQNGGDGCLNDCSLPVPDLCGNGDLDQGEECDDANLADDDGCGHSCLIERCGDGLTQFSRGEECDDANSVNGDGCDAACQVEPFVTTAAVKISGDLSCTTAVANAARKIAVDGSGTIYAVMSCDSTAMATVSHDRGLSFSEPLDLSTALPNGSSGVTQVAVASGPSGVAYVAIMTSFGEVYLRTTDDGGATWSAATALGSAGNSSAGLSLQSFNDNVYVGFSTGDGIAVARNGNRGQGSFEITSVQMQIVFFDLLYDIVQGTLVVAADTPSFHIRASSDGGVSFADEVNPPGQEYYSDWAIGNGRIFTSGIDLGGPGGSLGLYVIETSNLTSSTFVAGLPGVGTPQSRSLDADSAGNAFVASQLDGGGVQLDRLTAGGSTFDVPRLLHASATSPIVAPLPGNQGAAVIFTVGTEVYTTIQAY